MARREDWVVSPESILTRAAMHGLITIEEAESETFKFAALYEAERLRDEWPEGEGYGSSDFTYTVRSFLETAGVKCDFVDGKLKRL
jgi:hypothetical protein